MARLSGEPSAEEPDASIAHVRICGGPGRATSSAYPTQESAECPGRQHGCEHKARTNGLNRELAQDPRRLGKETTRQ